MIIQKNRRVRTSSQNAIIFAIKCHREKHLGTSINYRRFQKKFDPNTIQVFMSPSAAAFVYKFSFKIVY